MAAKGTQAKIEVLNKIKEAFGKDFIGEIDKKIYVWAQDTGERVQIAISAIIKLTEIINIRRMNSIMILQTRLLLRERSIKV